jgi:hypothetical protein
MPPAARGLFLKKPPPGPPQKLLIKLFKCVDADHKHRKTNPLAIMIHKIVYL